MFIKQTLRVLVYHRILQTRCGSCYMPMSWGVSPLLSCHHRSQIGIFCELAEGTVDPLIQVIDKNVLWFNPEGS